MDVQHGVLPTNLPLAKFDEEPVRTRQIALAVGVQNPKLLALRQIVCALKFRESSG